jgi:hypothetical protein
MIKKDWIKNTKRSDNASRFWYTLKNLDPFHMTTHLEKITYKINTKKFQCKYKAIAKAKDGKVVNH